MNPTLLSQLQRDLHALIRLLRARSNDVLFASALIVSLQMPNSLERAGVERTVRSPGDLFLHWTAASTALSRHSPEISQRLRGEA